MDLGFNPLTESFDRFGRTAFRFEAQREYPRDPAEEADFQSFLAGASAPVAEYGWMQEWLADLGAWKRAGKTVSRVRVVDNPATPYQQWLIWGHECMTVAGENIQYVSRSTAQQAGLPLHDWWLFDDQWVVEMWFSRKGAKLISRMPVTDPTTVGSYLAWRDAALHFATAPEHFAA
jgi:hypothetical protein